MAVRDLIPWGRTRYSVPSTMQGGGELDPFVTLHREMNRDSGTVRAPRA